MQLISSAAATVSPEGELAIAIKLLSGHPWLVLIAGAITAFSFQTSTATIALGIAFAASGSVSMSMLIPWILGANLGVGFTALAAGWRTLEGRRLGTANLLAKSVGTALIMLLLAPLILEWLGSGGASDARQAANFHTLFNLALGLLALPFVSPLIALVETLILPSRSSSGAISAIPKTYLDLKAVDTPAYALAQATREVLSMGDEVKSMLQTAWAAFMQRDPRLLNLAVEQDHRVDAIYHGLKRFLGLISEEELSPQDGHWHLTLLSFSNELEGAGDTISNNLCTVIGELLEQKLTLNEPDQAAVEKLYEKLIARCDIALSLLTTRDTALARSVLSGKESLNSWCRQAQREHYERLHAGGDATLRSSALFLEMLSGLRRINSHLSAIGYSLQPPGGPRDNTAADSGSEPSPASSLL